THHHERVSCRALTLRTRRIVSLRCCASGLIPLALRRVDLREGRWLGNVASSACTAWPLAFRLFPSLLRFLGRASVTISPVDSRLSSTRTTRCTPALRPRAAG